MEAENAALRAEVAKLRRQASANRREVAVWRELALREKCCLTALPEDVLQYIVGRIPLAHHIARAAPTSRAISVAARNAFKLRPFSSEVVTLAGHTVNIRCVAAAPDNRVKLFNINDGAVLRTFKHHTGPVDALALMPDGLRFASCSRDNTVRIVYHGLAQ